MGPMPLDPKSEQSQNLGWFFYGVVLSNTTLGMITIHIQSITSAWEILSTSAPRASSVAGAAFVFAWPWDYVDDILI